MQLEKSRSEFIKQGYGVAAISYDSRAILQNFATRMKIGFPLLSDERSGVIRSFGILNTSVKPGALDDGVPYPGIFIIDASGRIKAKYFEAKYQERFSPDAILTKEFASASGPFFQQQTEHLKVLAQLSQDRVRPGNRVTLTADLDLPPRMHVYAPGVKGYRPVSLGIEGGPDITVHDMEFPKSRIMELKAIKERVPIYEGKVHVARDFTVSPSVKAERLELRMILEYQACDDQICYAPVKVPFTFAVDVEQLERERVPEELRRRPGQ